MVRRADRVEDRIVVVGDALLDRDVCGTCERLSPDAPVPVLDESDHRSRPGGAALTATLAARRGAPVTLIAGIADDPAGWHLRGLLQEHGVDLVAVPIPEPTPEKVRFLAGDRPLLRVDRSGPPGPFGPLPTPVADLIMRAGVVAVSDYGRGMAADGIVRAILQRRRAATVWDPHPRGLDPVPGVTIATPNLGELSRAFPPQGRDGSLRDITTSLAEARQEWRAKAVAVTLGRRGALLLDGDGAPHLVPAPAVASGDPCGAGDCFVAALAAGLLAGGVLSEAVIAAVGAASRFVADGGAAGLAAPGPVRPHPAEGRSDPATDATARCEQVRAAGGTVVVAGGCFDLLHAGHVALLQEARRLGECLIVALNSDASVRRLKGGHRPIVPERDRAAVLESLACVDAVAIFDEDEPTALLQRLRPHVFAKGGDYAGRALPESDVLAEWGGQTVVLPYLDGRSTTALLQVAGNTR